MYCTLLSLALFLFAHITDAANGMEIEISAWLPSLIPLIIDRTKWNYYYDSYTLHTHIQRWKLKCICMFFFKCIFLYILLYAHLMATAETYVYDYYQCECVSSLSWLIVHECVVEKTNWTEWAVHTHTLYCTSIYILLYIYAYCVRDDRATSTEIIIKKWRFFNMWAR